MNDTAATKPQPIDCCIVGGGPAGMMLGLLLARLGLEVTVLEKHADFLRDFRGDTIHPSTLEVMRELGLLEQLLALPHRQVASLAARFVDADARTTTFPVADFSHLPTHCKFIAMMPQWDFLDLLARAAQDCPSFRLLRRTEAVDLLHASEDAASRVVGVRARGPDGEVLVHARLVVGADGRRSMVSAKAALTVDDIGAPMDVLWFSLSRRERDGSDVVGTFAAGRIFVLIDRGDHWQCGYVIAKGGFDAIRACGLDAFRADVVAVAPFARGRVDTEIADWDHVKLLTVGVDRLRRWHRDGLLCIGDAAHTMSPVGGVGINLAIQDAVATANLLADALLSKAPDRPTLAELLRVQRRREWPVRVTQALQVFVQKRVIGRVLTGHRAVAPPWPLKLLARWPRLRRLPGRLVGIGVRPEHIATIFRTDRRGPSGRADE